MYNTKVYKLDKTIVDRKREKKIKLQTITIIYAVGGYGKNLSYYTHYFEK